jgi:hypothetical protein
LCIGYFLTNEETDEILVIYYEWILQNNYDGCDVPFDTFEDWFTLLASRIVCNKNMLTDFNIDELIDTHESIFNEEWSYENQNDIQQNDNTHDNKNDDENCHVQ